MRRRTRSISTSLTRTALLAAGGKPLWSLTSLGDTGNGFLATVGILNALMDREKTGHGQFVDTSIINACLLTTSYAAARSDGSALDRPTLDKNQTGLSRHYRLYQTSDNGWVQVAAITAAQQAAFDELVGSDAEAAFAGLSAGQWLERLAKAGIPAELSDPRASLGLFDNALYRSRGWTTHSQDPYVGRIDQIGHCYSLSETPLTFQGGPLIVGRDTAALLAELGYSDTEISEMAAQNVIGCDTPVPAEPAVA